MKKYIFCFIFFISTYFCFADNNIVNLRETIICKQIFDFFVNSGYHEKYEFVYQLYYGPKQVFETSEAFMVIAQPNNEFVYESVLFIESYKYYGIPIEIHKVPNGSSFYYIAIVDITGGLGQGYEFLLFDENEIFLDEKIYASKYRNTKEIYRYIELYNGYFGLFILTNSSGTGSYTEYLDLLLIEERRFKVAFTEVINYVSEGEYVFQN